MTEWVSPFRVTFRPTEWEYWELRFDREPLHLTILDVLNREGRLGWQLATATDNRLILMRPKVHVTPPSAATSLVLSVQGGHPMASTFTVDTTTGLARLQFVDDHADAVVGPVDSVTGTPIAPVVTSDNSGVLTAAPANADPNVAGLWTSALAPVTPGVANVSVAPLVNSDGTPVLETVGPNVGQAFTEPAPVAVTVNPGAVAAMTLSVGS